MNGKGDKPRPVNKMKYDKNYKKIFRPAQKVLGPLEVDALMIVIKMAEGNMHCRQTDERKQAIKVLKNLIKL